MAAQSYALTARRDAVTQVVMDFRLAEQPADMIDALEEKGGGLFVEYPQVASSV